MTRTARTTVRPRPADPDRIPARGLRGLVAGLVSGVGAFVAHQLAGGHPAPVVAVVVALLAVAGGVALARWRIGWGTALALALATQATSHLLLVGSRAHDHAHPGHADPLTSVAGAHHALPMLLAHLGVAVATALVARQVDRVVLDLLRALVGWFRPRTWLPRAPLARTRFAHPTDARLLPSYVGVPTPLTRRGPPVPARPSLITP